MKHKKDSINKGYFLIILMFSLSLILISRDSFSESGKFGAGIIIGEPTGVSLKYDNFPVIGIAWSIDKHFRIHADYWILHDRIKNGLGWFAGFGGKYIYNEDADKNKNHDEHSTNLGVRVPVGLNYFFNEKIEVFIEAVPGIMLFPSTEADFDAGIGARFYF